MIVENIFHYVFDKRFIYQLIGTVSTYFVIKFLRFVRSRQQRYQIFKQYGIPGPEPNLLSGNLDTYTSRQGDNFFMIDVEFRAKYGKVYGFFLGDDPSIVVSDLDMLKEIFLEDKHKCMTERARTYIDSPIVRSVLFAPYPRWKSMRKTLSPHFSKYMLRGQSSTQFIEDTMRSLFGYIDQKFVDQSASGDEVQSIELDIFRVMKATTLRLISSMAINLPGVQIKEDDENVKSLDEYLSICDKGIVIWAVRLPILRPVLQFLADNFETNKTMKLVRNSLKNTLREGLDRLKGGKPTSEQQQVIDVMIKLHHDGLMTKEEVLGNAEALLIAGYDTTSTTLTYIFWVLASDPQVQEKLRSELMAHGIESKYLMQVINESMRLYPAVTTFTTRIATQTVEISGWTIPKGTRIVYNSWLMNRSPDIWNEPEKFDPDRFADSATIHPCAFAPFGLGDRKCLGYQLALLEIRMIICDMLLRYKLSLISPSNLTIVNCASVLTKPKESILLKLTRLQQNR